ncbi:hypothetical protein N7497_000800 [Penicillium chrysogenum]|nr:hypothetical protein N7497_000800 [Penicillium chrysogenum]
MSINSSLGPRSDNYSSRTPVITIGAIAGSLIFLAKVSTPNPGPCPPSRRTTVARPSTHNNTNSNSLALHTINPQHTPHCQHMIHHDTNLFGLHPWGGDINAHTHTYNPSNHANPHPGPSSRLSAVHYSDARLSTSRPVSMVGHGLLIGPVAAPTRSRHQAAMPPPPEQNSRQERRDRRERSVSEPIPSGQAAPKRPKPVLSRLITNFH